MLRLSPCRVRVEKEWDALALLAFGPKPKIIGSA